MDILITLTNIKCCALVKTGLVSSAAYFWDVTQRSPQRGTLRDIPENGCEGDYDWSSKNLLNIPLQVKK